MPDEFVDLEYDSQRVEANRGVLELAARQLRAFARCLIGNRADADGLVEDTLMLFLAEDRMHCETDACFAELLEVFRRVNGRLPLSAVSRKAPDEDFADIMKLSLAEREIASLILGARMPVFQAAGILQMTPSEAEALLEKARAGLGDGKLPDWEFIPGLGAGDGPDQDGGLV